MGRRILEAVAAVLVLGLAACTSVKSPPVESGTIHSSYRAVDHLLQSWGGSLDPEKPILVATLADNYDLERSSPLGRLVSEQMASRLVNAGYAVSEIRLRNGVLVKEHSGQFALSRDAMKIGSSSGAQAVLAGTYTVARDQVYVNLKLIRASDGRMLAAHDYILPMDKNIRHLTSDSQVTEF